LFFVKVTVCDGGWRQSSFDVNFLKFLDGCGWMEVNETFVSTDT